MDANIIVEFDGLAIARDRIAEEAKRRTGSLDLGGLGLTAPPAELLELRHLRRLSLGNGFRRADDDDEPSRHNGPPNQIDGWLEQCTGLTELEELSLVGAGLADLAGFSALRKLRTLDCSRTQISDLTLIGKSTALQRLDCSYTQITDLAPLATATALHRLDCSNTQITDLAPLAKLTALQQLDCSGTEITDLAPLAKLTSMRRINCAYTSVADLTPLTRLTALQRLDCSSTEVASLAPLARLTALQRLDFSHTQVGDLTPLASLIGLQRLLFSGTRVTDLALLSRLTGVQVLFCADTQVSSLAPLAKLTALRALDCSHTQVSDLSPLARLTSLQVLHCTGTQVTSLAPLAKLTAMQVLYCSHTPVADLTPLAPLSALRVLACASTKLTSLIPLVNVTALQEFSCAGTSVADLAPLAPLTSLQWLSCSSTAVRDLTPLSPLRALQVLSCSDTKVTNLTPLAPLASLQWLDCSSTAVTDLAPLGRLVELQKLDCSNCRLVFFPEATRNLPALQEFYLYRGALSGAPDEILSRSKRDNCLAGLRAHYDDLAGGAETVPDVKLLILGNGRVGKTQLSRQLRGQDFQPEWDSTHGVQVRPGELLEADRSTAARLQIWDFGGQDIYHGTHTLFLRTRAVFMLAWAADVEATPEYEHQGIRFVNHPLSYWAEYVRQFGDRDSPVLIVQTKSDTAAGDAPVPPVPPTALARFGYSNILQYSAANDRGREELNAGLRDAIGWLRHPDRQGAVMTGAARMRLRRRLEALRDAEAALPTHERRNRTLERTDFAKMYEEEGGAGAIEHVLAYLNNAGVVFYRKGLFGDRVVLDQAWALDAIYTVFQREQCYRQLQERHGRFTRDLLASLVWQDYSVTEQKLFLSMMQSCGICFIHRMNGAQENDNTEYLAPDLLPDRSAVLTELEAQWDNDKPYESETFSYTLLHPSLLRSLIARIGTIAGAHATYWRDGVSVYEAGTRSRAVITLEATENWSGLLHIHAQGGDAVALLRRLTEWVEEEHSRTGPRPEDVTRLNASEAVRHAEQQGMGSDSMAMIDMAAVTELAFGPAPAPVAA